MNKKLVIFFVLGLLLAAGVYMSKYVNSQVDGAFETLSVALSAEFNKKDSLLNQEYAGLLSNIDASDSLGPAVSSMLISTQKKYSGSILYIDKISQHLSKLDPLLKEQDPYGISFWLGEVPKANMGRGNGFAEKLRSTINQFRKEIAMENKNLALKKGIQSWYKPEILVDGEETSWEVQTFSGTIDVDIAKLEELKLEQATIFEKEIQFLSSLIQ